MPEHKRGFWVGKSLVPWSVWHLARKRTGDTVAAWRVIYVANAAKPRHPIPFILKGLKGKDAYLLQRARESNASTKEVMDWAYTKMGKSDLIPAKRINTGPKQIGDLVRNLMGGVK